MRWHDVAVVAMTYAGQNIDDLVVAARCEEMIVSGLDVGAPALVVLLDVPDSLAPVWREARRAGMPTGPAFGDPLDVPVDPARAVVVADRRGGHVDIWHRARGGR